MPITFYTASSNPADNGSLGTGSIVVPLPPAMTSGQLCVAYVSARSIFANGGIGSSGGQTWTEITWTNSGIVSIFWTRFNGAWTGSFIMTTTGTANSTAVLLVFNPSVASNLWGLESPVVSGSLIPNGAGPYGIPGTTVTNQSSVTIASWYTADDNSFTLHSGSADDWRKTGLSQQYRNLASLDASSTHAYLIRSSSGTIGAVSQSQVTVTNDSIQQWYRATFYEYSTSKPYFINWLTD